MNKVKKHNWIDMGSNMILKGKGVTISYNPNPGGGFGPFRGDGGSDETAILKGRKFYILNGDFRKDYEKLISKGYKACKAFFDKKAKKYKSSWSN